MEKKEHTSTYVRTNSGGELLRTNYTSQHRKGPTERSSTSILQKDTWYMFISYVLAPAPLIRAQDLHGSGQQSECATPLGMPLDFVEDTEAGGCAGCRWLEQPIK